MWGERCGIDSPGNWRMLFLCPLLGLCLSFGLRVPLLSSDVLPSLFKGGNVGKKLRQIQFLSVCETLEVLHFQICSQILAGLLAHGKIPGLSSCFCHFGGHRIRTVGLEQRWG